MKSEERDDRIQEFLEGTLQGEQLEQFEKEMENDPELEREVKGLKAVEMGLRSIGADRLKDEIEQWEKEFQNANVNEQSNVRSLKYYFSIAASLLILVTAGIYFLMNKPPDYQNLYADNFSPYEDMIHVRGTEVTGEEELLSEGMTAYNEGHYETAIEQLKDFLSMQSDQYGVNLYLGIAQMETGDFESAQVSLDEAKQDPMFAQQAEWYQALLFLKSEQIEKATQTLQNIAHQQKHYKAEAAKSLLSKID